MRNTIYLFTIVTLFFTGCFAQNSEKENVKMQTGAELTASYLPLLENKKVALVANHSTNINGSHLVDSLLSLNVNIVKIFSPEHGFRGDIEAGEHVKNYKDKKTGLSVISLYGSSKKPDLEDLKDIDLLIFDLQDVGVRFYTYISTMHYVMEACAELGLELMILDRPNPNGFYVDGPILDTNYRSFVGMHPVPIVHGMTIAEYAQMINGEGWLKNGIQCGLEIIKCANYTHDSLYQLPINPSPNLQNMLSVYLYPSLGFFEGTSLSAGRGTDFPFQVFGSPDLNNADFRFTPRSIEGVSKYPKFQNIECKAIDLRNVSVEELITDKKIQLKWLLFAYNNIENKKDFFNTFFNNISGSKKLRKQIESGFSEEEIKETWKKDLDAFKKIRSKYLLYEDFK